MYKCKSVNHRASKTYNERYIYSPSFNNYCTPCTESMVGLYFYNYSCFQTEIEHLFVGTPSITNFEGEIVTNDSIVVKMFLFCSILCKLYTSLLPLPTIIQLYNTIVGLNLSVVEQQQLTHRMQQNKLGGETCTSARASTTGLVKRTTKAMRGSPSFFNLLYTLHLHGEYGWALLLELLLFPD